MAEVSRILPIYVYAQSGDLSEIDISLRVTLVGVRIGLASEVPQGKKE